MIYQIQADSYDIDTINVSKWLMAFKNYIQPERIRLGRYYDGKTSIVKQGAVEGRPNYTINVNLAKYITDVATGYVFGKPITYSTENEQTAKALKIIDFINKNNNIDEIDFNIGGDMSTYGVGYQLILVKDGEEPIEERVLVQRLNPEQTFYVVDNTVLRNPLCAIYYYNYFENEQYKTRVYVYDREILRIYEGFDCAIEEVAAEYHNMGGIPIIESLNNDDAFGDFQQVTDLLDALNLSVSNNTDNLQSIANAIMTVTGAKLNAAQIEDINRFKVMNLPQGCNAEWLIKSINPEAEKMQMENLLNFIFQISQVPDLTDSAFGGTQSGVAMQYKLWGVNQLWASKVRKYTKSIYERLSMFLYLAQYTISTPVQVKTEIKITFYKNLPTDHSEEYEMVKALKGTVSEKLLLENLSIVSDVDKELKEISNEQQRKE